MDRRSGSHCRFVSSLGGVQSCQDSPYREGFCRFHHEALVKGDLLPNGQISERLTDQHRRRALNYHAIALEDLPSPDPFHR